jgi:hypothetical protein
MASGMVPTSQHPQNSPENTQDLEVQNVSFKPRGGVKAFENLTLGKHRRMRRALSIHVSAFDNCRDIVNVSHRQGEAAIRAASSTPTLDFIKCGVRGRFGINVGRARRVYLRVYGTTRADAEDRDWGVPQISSTRLVCTERACHAII